MSHQLRKGLPDIPERMRSLPVEARGYPVPYFVAWIDGKPDFRVSDGSKLNDCVTFRKCWLCGQNLGAFGVFAIGPMCAINRISNEPPSHRECAEFAAKACPFLVMPKAKRRETGLPGEAVAPPGEMIRRNPGVVLLWVTRRWAIGGHGLFELGEPTDTLWFTEGRAATRAEIMDSIESGLPALQSVTASEMERAALAGATKAAMKYLPAS